MPYQVYNEDGKFCVHKKVGDEKGALVPGGCHSDQDKAKAHQRALYAAEGRSKELTDDQMEFMAQVIDDSTETKATDEDNALPDSAFLYVESGEKDSDGRTIPTSKRHFPVKTANGSVDLPRLRNALTRLEKPSMKEDGETWLSDSLRPRLQSRAKNLLEGANKSLGEKIKEWFMSAFGWEIKEVPKKPEMMLWKEANGDWKWMARYSNNFRDRDNPPEIIASQSHKKFVDKVDKGLVPSPELWFWHVKEWKWGIANWVGYDDKGFALALGSVDEGCEAFAEYIASLDPKELRVSHGMPKSTIVRDPEDPTVIIEHETVEISPLPARAAANTLTSFSILSKEDKMAIPAEKRKTLIEEFGIPEEVLDSLETQNAAQAKEANDAGIQSKEAASPAAPSKETPATVVPPAIISAPVIKESPEVSTPANPNTPTPQEIADAVAGVLNERLTAIDQRFARLEAALRETQGTIKDLKQTDDEKIAKEAAKTPIGSLAALISRSVIGNPDTVVDGRTSLAKAGPKETPVPQDMSSPVIGIRVVNDILKEYDNKPK